MLITTGIDYILCRWRKTSVSKNLGTKSLLIFDSFKLNELTRSHSIENLRRNKVHFSNLSNSSRKRPHNSKSIVVDVDGQLRCQVHASIHHISSSLRFEYDIFGITFSKIVCVSLQAF